MKSNILITPFRWRVKAAGGVMLCAAIVMAAGIPRAANGEESGPYYNYGNQRIRLTARAGEVLVQDGLKIAEASRIQRTATALSVPNASVVAIGLPGWAKVNVNASRNSALVAPNASAVPGSVAALSARPELTFATPVFETPGGARVAPTHQILLRYRAGFDPASSFATFKFADLVSQVRIGQSEVWLLTTRSRDGLAVLNLANELHGNPSVAFATPDFIQTARTNFVPTDPRFTDCWGLRNTGQPYTKSGYRVSGLPGFDLQATQAWDVTRGSSTITVLVLDEGTQLNHPDLTVMAGRDFTGLGGNGGPVFAGDNHGTAVAGCIAGKANEVGSIGIAPNVRIATAKIAADGGDGWLYYRDSNVVGALEWGRQIGAKVSNSSWGGGSPSSVVTEAFRATLAAGMIHFAAAGNDDRGSVIFPASCPHVNAVGAALPNGRRVNKTEWSWGSNYGVGLKFMAPGECMVTTDRTGTIGYESGDDCWFNGTSAASPYAAGIAALLLSREPSLTPAQVVQRMINSCKDMGVRGYDTETGHGLLSAYLTLVPNAIVPTTDDYPDALPGFLTTIPGSRQGVLEVADDTDMFRFVLATASNVTMSSTSTLDLTGTLYDAGGNQLDFNDDFSGRLDFSIARTLQPGTYHLAVRSYGARSYGNYRIDLTAVTAGTPVMRITGAGRIILDGDSTPATEDGTAFPSVSTRGEVRTADFIVRNTGTAPLLLSGNPRVVVSGPQASQFRVAVLPAQSVNPSGSATFRIQYAPTTTGTHAATVSITSNDRVTSPYVFGISGRAQWPVNIDDHPDIAPGTRIEARSATQGNIQRSGDVDYFRFSLTSTRTVTIRTTGATDTFGYLEDSRGYTLASDDDSAGYPNFWIRRSLPAGTYNIKVKGFHAEVRGAYTLILE
ncbi:MAG: DVUA0089 family protein [Verrucomicrobiales bacterium]